MEPQSLTPEFREFLMKFLKEHKKGECQCGESHTPYSLQLKAVKDFQLQERSE